MSLLNSLLGRSTTSIPPPHELVMNILRWNAYITQTAAALVDDDAAATTAAPAATTANAPNAPTAAAPDMKADIYRELEALLMIMYGENETKDVSHTPTTMTKMAQEACTLLIETDGLASMIHNIRKMEFETRKLAARIVQYMLCEFEVQTVEYFAAIERRKLLHKMVDCYHQQDVAVVLCLDIILRACIMKEKLTYIILNEDNGEWVLPYFRYVQFTMFDISSHAFDTLKLLLSEHKQLASDYLIQNYEIFFTNYNKLLKSSNYVCMLQAFQLLSKLLMERSNFEIMIRYVNDARNLKLAMMALRGPRAQQVAAFHVLKIFIPNTNKPESIHKILYRNRDVFLKFLANFETDTDDEELAAHKAEFAASLESLEPI